MKASVVEIELKKRLESAWKNLPKSSMSVIQDVLDVVENIRILKNNSIILINDAITLIELSALHLLGYSYFNSGNISQALFVSKELYDLSESLNNIEYKALSEHVIAKIEIQKGNWKYAKQILEGVLKTLEDIGNHEYIQIILIDLSTIEHTQSNYENCLVLLHRAESEYQKYPVNPRVASAIISNTADIFMRIGNLDKAIEYIHRSLQESKQANDLPRYSNSLLRLSNVFSRQGDINSQITALQEAIEVLYTLNMDYQIAIMKIALGTAYYDLNNFQNALLQFQLALTTLEKEKDLKNLAILHQRMGMLYSQPSFEERNSETAHNYFKQAEQTAIELSMPHFQAAVLESWAEACVSFGLFENGFNLLKRSTVLEKQILNEKSLQQLRDLEVKYDVALKQKDNELLAANNKSLEMERNHLEFQLSTNNKSLLIQMNELNAFRSDVINIIAQLDKQDEIGRKLKTKVRESHLMQGTWASYLETFSKVHPDFQATLTSKYRNLTRMEVKICILIKAGLTSEEIAQILSLSARTIENNRLRIRKKLNLGERESLSKYLIEL